MVDVDDFSEVKECVYKDEHYSVRDNGAIMRHAREGMRKRKLDEKWTFGIPNISTGYMDYGGERVHRIVATAFHGPAPSPDHVVDHIDTNRQNNRPENLRWFTRLENALNNPITREKIIYFCGSIEAFLANPQMLRGFETEDKNFAWMKTVTKEEAQNCLANWNNWVKKAKQEPNIKKSGPRNNNWMFNNPFMNKVPNGKGGYIELQSPAPVINETNLKAEPETIKTKSLTQNAVQLNWKYPVAFPCCPQEFSSNPLEAYMANLEEGKVFSTNKLGDSTILRFGMPQSDCLWVMCKISISWKTHAFTKITYKDGIFYHENKGAFDIGDEPEELFDSILKGEITEI